MDPRPDIKYNRDLDDLVSLLDGVTRPGDFFTSGEVGAPPPALTVEGVGRIAFPLLPVQAEAIAKVASQAPYGRGEETLVDREVRDAHQVEPDAFHPSGKRWSPTLAGIVKRTAEGLGCIDFETRAELYKLLLYREGGFFVAHRDTEKTKGMFGTLVVSLPSEHTGGDLVVRHQGREARVSLQPEEDMALSYAAFYADCEHEVRPIESGARLCLVYNLVRGRRKKGAPKTEPAPPDHAAETDAAEGVLGRWRKAEDRSRKIVYLLAHEYTPEGLGFDGLKHGDAAQAKVLVEAARRCGLAVYLGIVHIEESGAAEVYGGYGYGSRYDDDPEDYELYEVDNSDQNIGDWVDLEGRRVDFGPIPLADGELIPAGALDDEPPDDIRVSEATGNEGGDYERFYHRAALILWPEPETEDVLLQAGAEAAVPHFGEVVARAASKGGKAAGAAAAEEARRLARKLIGQWPIADAGEAWLSAEKIAGRERARVPMLAHLNAFGDPALIREFIEGVVARLYGGSEPENAELLRAAAALKVTDAAAALSAVVRRRGAQRFANLVDGFAGAVEAELPAGVIRAWAQALIEVAGAIKPPSSRRSRSSGLAALAELDDWDGYWDEEEEEDRRPKKREGPRWPVDGGAVFTFLATLARLPRARKLLADAAGTMLGRPKTFRPDAELFDALVLLREAGLLDLSDPRGQDGPFPSLWVAVVEFHLKRSGRRPQPPGDWRLRRQQTSCRCEDCARLMAFARDPDQREARFALAKKRRQHLHNQIDNADMEMTHETERRGSPYTLVLTKTRWRFEARLKEYQADIGRIQNLALMVPAQSPVKFADLAGRLREASARAAAE